MGVNGPGRGGRRRRTRRRAIATKGDRAHASVPGVVPRAVAISDKVARQRRDVARPIQPHALALQAVDVQGASLGEARGEREIGGGAQVFASRPEEAAARAGQDFARGRVIVAFGDAAVDVAVIAGKPDGEFVRRFLPDASTVRCPSDDRIA